MKHFKYIKNEIAVFEQMKIAFGGQVIPCTEAEVNELESMLPDSYHLPIAYKEFLLYGGKEMGDIFNVVDFSYGMARILLKNQYQSIYEMVKWEEEPGWKLPENIFAMNNHPSANFHYFWLTDGENPPIYWWEEDEGSLKEASRKEADSFSEFLMGVIKDKARFLSQDLTTEKIEAGKPPRGQQFWIPNETEYKNGISIVKLTKRLGLGNGRKLHKARAMLRLDANSYLEELSGWKARQVGDEIRFFPPSYISPEEKASLRKNQLESKKQELAKVEKIIANRQNRIKNLSEGKLTGGRSINFNNSSALRIKELELDLRKQKVNKRKLEKDIRSLEEDSK